MPLLNKKPFVIRSPPDDLEPDEEIFVCRWTNEAFRDYEEYVDRTIQCSSLVWSCELTGKSGLTYREAVDSESEAKRQIESFPDSLRRAVLFLASQVRRNGISLLVEDVFAFYRDRFVEGEEVEVSCLNQKFDARVVSVWLSDHIYEGSVSDWHGGMAYGYKYVAAVVGPRPDSFLYRVKYLSSTVSPHAPTVVWGRALSRRKTLFSKERIKLILRFSMHRSGNSEKTPWKVKPEIIERYSLDQPPSHLYYLAYNPAVADPHNGVAVTEFLPTLSTQEEACSIDSRAELAHCVATQPGLTAEESQIVASSPLDCRQTRSSIFPPLSMSSPLSVNQDYLKRTMEVLEQLSHSSLSPSERKVLWEEEVARRQEEKKAERAIKKQELEALKVRKDQDRQKKKEEKRLVSDSLRLTKEQEKSRKKEEKLKVAEMERQKKREDREKERERARKERETAREAYLEWARPRDDLECDDHKALPRPTPVHTRLQSEQFHEALMLLEFMQTFQQFLDMEEPYEDGYTLELIEEALVSNSSHSPLCAITRSLLKGIFHLQDAEEECKPAVLNTFPQDQSTTSKVEDANVDVKESVTDAEESQRVDEGPTDLPVEMPEVDQISQHDGPTDASADQLQGMEVSDPVTTQGLQQREVGCDQGLGSQQSDDLAVMEDEDEPSSISSALDSIQSARDAFLWPLHHQGTLLGEIPLDSLTITDALRLHLMCTGGRAFSQVANFRYTRRGGFTDNDDPVFELKSSDPALVKKLETEVIYDLIIEEKLRLLSTLSNQLLTFAAVRDFMEQSMAQYRQVKRELKDLQQEMDKRRREEILSRRQKRREEKEKKVNGEMKKGEAASDLVCTETMVDGVGGKNRKQHKGEEESRSGFSSSSENEENVQNRKEEREPRDWREEMEKREAELLERMALERAPYNLHPLGVDRIYQHYWLFPSLPAVFVQETDSLCGQLVQSQLRLRPYHPLPLYDSPPPVSATPSSGWAMYTKVHEIESLESCLNQRGYRERSLREQLRRQKLWVTRSLADSDHTVRRLSEKESDEKEDTIPIQAQQEMLHSLRQKILDTEDKVWNGNLGRLNGCKRDDWRNRVTQIEFSPSDGSSVDDAGRLSAIQALSQAVVDIEGAVERRFLSKPLTAEMKKSSLALKDVHNSRWLLKNLKQQLESGCLELWRTSLLSSVSLSQIALHLTTLERSILWSKSVLNTSCRLCKRKGDAHLMLLCDGCDRGHHTYCLVPPMEDVPEGDWFCEECVSRPGKRKRGRSRRNVAKNTKGGRKGGKRALQDGAKKKRMDEERGRKKTPPSFDDEFVYDVPIAIVCNRRKSMEARGSDRASQLKVCEDLWKELKSHSDSWPFLEPVSRKAYPDYYEIVDNPVDLQSIRHKLNVMDYGSPEEFAADVRLMFRNCAVYNTARSGVGRAGVKLSRFFEKRLAQMGLCRPVKRGSAVH